MGREPEDEFIPSYPTFQVTPPYLRLGNWYLLFVGMLVSVYVYIGIVCNDGVAFSCAHTLVLSSRSKPPVYSRVTLVSSSSLLLLLCFLSVSLLVSSKVVSATLTPIQCC